MTDPQQCCCYPRALLDNVAALAVAVHSVAGAPSVVVIVVAVVLFYSVPLQSSNASPRILFLLS